MTTADKDTIYIDIDDEITSVIDKLRSSDGKITALVLPKRASVFQSIVNMKLLKRAADDSKKHLVLITSEAGLLPLAGLAGVHVAKTLTSKPEIPASPAFNDDDETIQEEGEDITDELPEDAADKPVGELAAAAGLAAGASTIDKDGVETLTLDDDDAPEVADDVATKDFTPPVKGKKDKKLAIPNFEKFRLLLALAALVVILLIAGGIYAVVKLPKATIEIKTDAANVNTSLNLDLSSAAKTLKVSTNTVPAKVATQQKSYTQQATATGQKNKGTKAQGSVTLTNCDPNGDPITVPAGTGVSANGQTYITQQSGSMETSTFKGKTGSCQSTSLSTTTVTVIAQNPGTSFNIASGVAMQVAGYGAVTAQSSSQISGGTDNIVQIVTQSDIDGAKSKISTTDTTIKQTLQNELKQDGYRSIDPTYSTGTPSVTSSAQAGETASTVTVTSAITYTMFGVHNDDLKSLLSDAIKKQIDTSKQSVLSDGLAGAAFSVTNATATDAQVLMTAVATAGPDLNVQDIINNAAGKKPAEVRASLQNNPDVTSVDVKLSPFFVSSVPKKTDRIKVNIAKPSTTKASSSNDKQP